jgi:hypothetical protein
VSLARLRRLRQVVGKRVAVPRSLAAVMARAVFNAAGAKTRGFKLVVAKPALKTSPATLYEKSDFVRNDAVFSPNLRGT